MSDQVSNPKHYNAHPSGFECIDVVRDLPFALGNAIKYVWRRDHKNNHNQDCDKAIWYLNDLALDCKPAYEADVDIVAMLVEVGRAERYEVVGKFFLCAADYVKYSQGVWPILGGYKDKRMACIRRMVCLVNSLKNCAEQ